MFRAPSSHSTHKHILFVSPSVSRMGLCSESAHLLPYHTYTHSQVLAPIYHSVRHADHEALSAGSREGQDRTGCLRWPSDSEGTAEADLRGYIVHRSVAVEPQRQHLWQQAEQVPRIFTPQNKTRDIYLILSESILYVSKTVSMSE